MYSAGGYAILRPSECIQAGSLPSPPVPVMTSKQLLRGTLRNRCEENGASQMVAPYVPSSSCVRGSRLNSVTPGVTTFIRIVRVPQSLLPVDPNEGTSQVCVPLIRR